MRRAESDIKRIIITSIDTFRILFSKVVLSFDMTISPKI